MHKNIAILVIYENRAISLVDCSVFQFIDNYFSVVPLLPFPDLLKWFKR